MKSRSARPSRIRDLQFSQVCYNKSNVGASERRAKRSLGSRLDDYGPCLSFEIFNAAREKRDFSFMTFSRQEKSPFLQSTLIHTHMSRLMLSSCYPSASISVGAFRASHECLRKGNPFGHEVRRFLFVSGNNILLSLFVFFFLATHENQAQ